MTAQGRYKDYIIFGSNDDLAHRFMAANGLTPLHQFGHAVFVARKDDDGIVPQTNMIASVYDADNAQHRTYLTERAALTDNERLLVAAWLRARDKDEAGRAHQGRSWGNPPRP